MQRVRKGSVLLGEITVSEIGRGLVVLLGVGRDDRKEDAVYLADKIVNLRIFEDENGKMNLSVADTGGEILAVSQFTLYGDCRQGRRPGFTEAAPPETARALYDLFIDELKNRGAKVGTGVFRENMLVRIENDGPVTMLLDSRKLF